MIISEQHLKHIVKKILFEQTLQSSSQPLINWFNPTLILKLLNTKITFFNNYVSNETNNLEKTLFIMIILDIFFKYDKQYQINIGKLNLIDYYYANLPIMANEDLLKKYDDDESILLEHCLLAFIYTVAAQKKIHNNNLIFMFEDCFEDFSSIFNIESNSIDISQIINFFKAKADMSERAKWVSVGFSLTFAALTRYDIASILKILNEKIKKLIEKNKNILKDENKLNKNLKDMSANYANLLVNDIFKVHGAKHKTTKKPIIDKTLTNYKYFIYNLKGFEKVLREEQVRDDRRKRGSDD